MPAVRAAAFDDVAPRTLYALLRLRVDTFVVEQRCAYPELDGRDVEAGTVHLWIEEAGLPVAYLRTLDDGPGLPVRIGRVCTAPAARGRGLAAALVGRALELAAGRPTALEAQAHLTQWYAALGFTVAGEAYVEDGIPHVSMVRPPSPPPG